MLKPEWKCPLTTVAPRLAALFLDAGSQSFAALFFLVWETAFEIGVWRNLCRKPNHSIL